jgi:ribosomal protein S12 methylthiotransferase
MNRRGDAETYLALVARIRKRLPDAVIRTTFLVGFPGETEEDYLALRDFQDRAKLDWVGVFTYSREEDTPAFSMKAKRVPMKVARERKAGIESAQQAITSARLERFVGRRLPVIVEEAVEGEELFLCRAYLQAPEVDGLTVVHSGRTLSPGETLNCAVARVNGVDLEAAEDAGA